MNSLFSTTVLTEIRLSNTNRDGDTGLVANVVIMPKSLKTIGESSFANQIDFDSDDNIPKHLMYIQDNHIHNTDTFFFPV